MHLAKKKHRPRYRGIMQLRKLEKQLPSMKQTAGKLKKDRETSEKEVEKLSSTLDASIKSIKTNPQMQNSQIENLHRDLLSKFDQLLRTLTQRVEAEKNAEEQERARKMREEMERQKKEKEEQEKLKRAEEENRRKKVEMEARRKDEEAAAIAREKARQAAGKSSDPSQDSLINFSQNVAYEQEKRDAELAFRLAQESNGNVTMEDATTPTQLKRSNYVVSSRAGKKHDLSGWKYSQLRDIINTSCDVELLEACREEFHRRLKVYHAWKARHRSGKPSTEMDERAPKSIYQHQQTYQPTSSPSPPPGGVPQQRYFRIPFAKDGQNKGLWFAHFDGQYIVRQMEIHQGKPPVCLIAGTVTNY